VGGVVHFSGTTPTTADVFATSVQQPGGSPAMQGITAAANVVTFPAGIAGNYLLSFSVSGSATAQVGTGGTATLLKLFSAGNSRDFTAAVSSAAGASASQTFSMVNETVSVPNAGATVSFSCTITAGAGMDLFITWLPVTVLTLAEREELEIEELQEENKLLNDRLSRIEQMLAASSSVPSWLGSRLSAEEKEDEDSEGNVYVPARPRKLPARVEPPSLEALRR